MAINSCDVLYFMTLNIFPIKSNYVFLQMILISKINILLHNQKAICFLSVIFSLHWFSFLSCNNMNCSHIIVQWDMLLYSRAFNLFLFRLIEGVEKSLHFMNGCIVCIEASTGQNMYVRGRLYSEF